MLSVKFLFLFAAFLAVFVSADSDAENHDGESDSKATDKPAGSPTTAATIIGVKNPLGAAGGKPETKPGKL